MKLEKAVEAERAWLETPGAGRLGYYVDATAGGRPLVLVHSVNAAPSAFEMKPLFDHYRSRRPVFALDLPGFGCSERGDRRYTPALYVEALNALLAERVREPADVVALSLAAEFAAAAALEQPEGIASLVLISPTGLSRRAPPGPTASRRMRGLFGLPWLSDGLFALLTSRPSLRYFLGLNFRGRPSDAMIDYAYQTSHQPGAKYAPYAFLSFALFSPDACERLYAPLEIPVLVLFDEDPNVSFERLPELERERAGWRSERVRPTRGLPHWEELEESTAAMDRFWQEAARGSGSAG